MAIKILCSYSKLVPISKLKPNPLNRNLHSPEQVERLAQLMKFQGIRHPILVSKNSGFIAAGHARLEAAKKLKLKNYPVDYQTFTDEAQEYAFLQSDNAIALWAELQIEPISTDMAGLSGLNIDYLGIQGFNLPEPGLDNTSHAVVGKTPTEKLEGFLNAKIKPITLYYKSREYEKIIKLLDKVMEIEKVQDHSSVVRFLLENYARNKSK